MEVGGGPISLYSMLGYKFDSINYTNSNTKNSFGGIAIVRLRQIYPMGILLQIFLFRFYTAFRFHGQPDWSLKIGTFIKDLSSIIKLLNHSFALHFLVEQNQLL